MTVLTTFASDTTGANARDTLNDMLARLNAVTAANLTFGTSMTASGTFSSTNYGKLTRVTAASVAVTFPSATGLTDGTLIDLWFTGGAGTANGVAVQAGGRILFAAVSNAWVQMKPFEAAGSGGGGGPTSYSHYKLVATSNAGAGDANDLNISELYVYSDASTRIAGTMSASSTQTGLTPASLNDNNNSTYWERNYDTPDTFPYALTLAATTPAPFFKLGIRDRYGYGSKCIGAATLYGFTSTPPSGTGTTGGDLLVTITGKNAAFWGTGDHDEQFFTS